MAERNLRKTRTGMVVSDKMDKTVVVAIQDNVRHPLYKKIVKRTVRLKANDRCPRTRDGASSTSSRRPSKRERFTCRNAA